MIYAWLSRYLLSWLGKGILIAGATVGTALMACRIAWHHRVAANVAAVAGISAVAVLMWVTHWCGTLGGMVVGAVVAGMIMAVAAVARVQSDRGILKELDGWWSRPASPGAGTGMVRFAQISLGLYFGIIALMAAAGTALAESRWEVLTVAGVGITAASVISEKTQIDQRLGVDWRRHSYWDHATRSSLLTHWSNRGHWERIVARPICRAAAVPWSTFWYRGSTPFSRREGKVS